MLKDKIISDAIIYYYKKMNDKKPENTYCRMFRNDEELDNWLERQDNIEEYNYITEDIKESELGKEFLYIEEY